MAKTVLSVDDSASMRQMVKLALNGAGYDVIEAADGKEALESCRASLPDCVLLDWNMPVMDGMAFLKAVRSEFGPAKPPVVFCTTENDMSRIMEAIENGAQEYIMKPFDEDILTGKLAQVGLL